MAHICLLVFCFFHTLFTLMFPKHVIGKCSLFINWNMFTTELNQQDLMDLGLWEMQHNTVTHSALILMWFEHFPYCFSLFSVVRSSHTLSDSLDLFLDIGQVVTHLNNASGNILGIYNCSEMAARTFPTFPIVLNIGQSNDCNQFTVCPVQGSSGVESVSAVKGLCNLLHVYKTCLNNAWLILIECMHRPARN